jgi:type III secretion system YscI/HrpB-like protein
MIDNIASGLARMSLGLTGVGLGQPSGASPTDAQRFLTALNTPAALADPQIQVANGPTEPSRTAQAEQRRESSPSAPRSVGDAILNTFTSTTNGTAAEWKAATQAVMQRELSTSEMLQVQVRLINVSFQLELISKGVSKMTTNLDQTLKTQ